MMNISIKAMMEMNGVPYKDLREYSDQELLEIFCKADAIPTRALAPLCAEALRRIMEKKNEKL